MDNCFTQFQDSMKLHLSQSRGISPPLSKQPQVKSNARVVQKRRTVFVSTVSLPQLSEWLVLSCIDSVKATFGDVVVHIFNILRGINYLEQMIKITSWLFFMI